LGSVPGGRSAFCCNSPLVLQRGLDSTAALLPGRRDDVKLDRVAADKPANFG
jgi:hypothetical protein